MGRTPSYEVIYIVDPDLPEEEVQGLVEKFGEIAQQYGASVEKVDRWERRKLAYQIKGKAEGLYVVANVKAEKSAIDEIDRALRLNESVLRHMVVQAEGKQAEEKDPASQAAEEDQPSAEQSDSGG